MTETLLQKLEEKMMMLLSEVETLRKELQRAQQENVAIKVEREGSARKLQDLISLLDSLSAPVHAMPVIGMAAMADDMMARG